MDIEKLIKRLYCPQIHSCPMDGEYPSCNACQKLLVEDIATALSTLRAENEKLRAGLEQAKAERDAAISDLETIMAYGGGNLDTCQYCKNGQCYARGGTKLCLPLRPGA